MTHMPAHTHTHTYEYTVRGREMGEEATLEQRVACRVRCTEFCSFCFAAQGTQLVLYALISSYCSLTHTRTHNRTHTLCIEQLPFCWLSCKRSLWLSNVYKHPVECAASVIVPSVCVRVCVALNTNT